MTAKTVFDANDLSDYLKEVAGKDPKVIPLERGAWVKVGNFKIYLLDVIPGTDHSHIKVLIGRHRELTDDVVVAGKGSIVAKCCYQIPGTNLFFELFVDGDTGDITPLVVEKGFGVTTIEDFMKIATNLPDSALERVAKAVITKQVGWDESKTSLVGEGCDGEFVFEGCRYTFDEVFESPSGLFLIDGSSECIGNLLEILETERISLLNSHQYSKAKDVHENMESLKKVLQKV